MSRHRNIRTKNYDDYDDVDEYGKSYNDEEIGVSPGTVSQFMYRRDDPGKSVQRQPTLPEEDPVEDDLMMDDIEERADETSAVVDLDRMKLCIDYIENCSGDAFTREQVKRAVLAASYNAERALQLLLDHQGNLPVVSVTAKAPVPFLAKKLESLSVSGGDKRAFPRPESTPNLRLLDPGRSQPGTPTPGSPKGTRRGASKPFSSRATSRADESQGDTATLSTSKTPEVPSRSLIKITALYEQRQSSSKPLINLIVIGHVDAGKSTLMGHLLYKLGRVDAKQMAKFEHEANKIGKSSFKYAWVLDETGEERSRGITIDVAQTSFETTNKCINLMDAPGHKDFIPNMITGTAQADVAVLVVDATRGEFETGFQSGGQTREHTLLARSLGVAQLIVAVNKMDTVNWSQERFDQIVQMLAPFFKAVGFKDADVDFVPCSGFTGDNLTESPRTVEAAHWWTGPTLVERIDQFRPPVRQIDKPFRQIITDVFKSQAGGFSVAGKIEAGHIQTGDRVTIMPAGAAGVIKSITMDSGAALNAFAGDSVTVALSGIDILNVHVGDILCDSNNLVPVTSRLKARIALFTPKVPLLAGQECVFHNQSYTESCLIKKLLSQINRNTGEIQKKNPRMLTKNTSGEIELTLQRPVCAELYSASRELGRFMLRDSGTTIAAGVITEILS